jgi:hypothetical protein
MKTYKLAAFVAAAVISVSAAAATTVVKTDPVTGVWHATTGVVAGVGSAAVDTWNGAVHGTAAVVDHTTRALTPAGGTTVRHTAGHTTVHHY